MPEVNKSPRSRTKSILSFSPKDRIDHSVFGLGTIAAITEHLTTIAFDESGTRRFLTSMVKVTHSDTPAPAKPVRKKAVRKKKVAKSS